MPHDLIIIGAGPAGLSAAIQAKRLGLDLKVFERDRPGGQALAAHSIENYPGFAFAVSGPHLMERFTEQSASLGVDIESREATRIDHDGTAYTVETADGPIQSRAIIVASGLSPKRLDIKGASSLEGERIFYYADPSHIEHRGKRVLVVGGGDAAFDQAINFADKASEVTIAMRGASPRCLFLLTRRAERRRVKVMRSATPVAIARGDDDIAVSFAPTGSAGTARTWEHKTDLLIGCVGKTSDLALLKPLFKRAGRFPIKPGAVKKWPGLYLAGDLCRGHLRQISIAAGDGMRAAMDAHAFLIETSNHEHPFVHR